MESGHYSRRLDTRPSAPSERNHDEQLRLWRRGHYRMRARVHPDTDQVWELPEKILAIQ